MNTWYCPKDCQWLTPEGCAIDDEMPNPKGDLTFENDPQYPTCWMYMKPLNLTNLKPCKYGQKPESYDWECSVNGCPDNATCRYGHEDKLIREEIFATCIKRYGVDSQAMLLLEEMAELQKAVLKLKRQDYRWITGSKQWENLAEEVADVELMLEEIKYMFEISRTEERKQFKLSRLQELMK